MFQQKLKNAIHTSLVSVCLSVQCKEHMYSIHGRRKLVSTLIHWVGVFSCLVHPLIKLLLQHVRIASDITF